MRNVPVFRLMIIEFGWMQTFCLHNSGSLSEVKEWVVKLVEDLLRFLGESEIAWPPADTAAQTTRTTYC